MTATELIKTVTAFNGQKAELETFNSHVDEAYSTAIQIGVVAGYATGLVNTVPLHAKNWLSHAFWLTELAGTLRMGFPKVLICGMSLGVYFGSIWVLQDYESATWQQVSTW